MFTCVSFLAYEAGLSHFKVQHLQNGSIKNLPIWFTSRTQQIRRAFSSALSSGGGGCRSGSSRRHPSRLLQLPTLPRNRLRAPEGSGTPGGSLLILNLDQGPRRVFRLRDSSGGSFLILNLDQGSRRVLACAS